MSAEKFGRWVMRAYLTLFLVYMLAPLAVMGGAGLNDSRFPSVYPWRGLTNRWFVDLWEDERMWGAIGGPDPDARRGDRHFHPAVLE